MYCSSSWRRAFPPALTHHIDRRRFDTEPTVEDGQQSTWPTGADRPGDRVPNIDAAVCSDRSGAGTAGGDVAAGSE